jgi:hypothetical protein
MKRDPIIGPWVKSSYSNSGANCVEVACNPHGTVAVRDSKDPGGPVIAFAAADWQAFTGYVKAGCFGLA